MGDTFLDSWQEEVPETMLGWQLVDIDNSKWDGNFYRYSMIGKPNNTTCEVFVRSLSPDEKKLIIGVFYRNEDTGVEIKCSEIPWEVEPRNNFLKALTDAIFAFQDIIKHAKNADEQITSMKFENSSR